MSVVLDASIVGCWCFPDETSSVAETAMREVAADEAVVPAVWWFEVRNLLLIGERVGRMDPIGTAGFLADLEALLIRIDRASDKGESIDQRFARVWKERREPMALEASVPGVFAAGDVRGGAMNRVASAVGEGSMVVRLAHEYLALG